MRAYGGKVRLTAACLVGVVLSSSCDSDDDQARPTADTGPPRGAAAQCRDINPAPPVAPTFNAAACAWWMAAEDIVGVGDLVISTAEEAPGRFTMAAVRATTGEQVWRTPALEAVTDRAHGGERSLHIVHWDGKPFAAFQYHTPAGVAAATFVALHREGDRTPVTWTASDPQARVHTARDARDGVTAAAISGVVPQPWDVVDPTSGRTTRLPTSASEAVAAIGDGWFAEGNVDGFTFRIKRYDGSVVWDSADAAPPGANPRGTREVVAAYGDYVLARWIHAGTEGVGHGVWLLAVHDRSGQALATTEFGTFGSEDPTEPARPEPADRVVASPDQRWLAVHSGQNAAVLNLARGKAVPLPAGSRPYSVTDAGEVYLRTADGAATVDGSTGRIVATWDARTLLPAAVVDGVGVVSSTAPDTVLAGRHATATAWGFGSRRVEVARRLAPKVWRASGDDNGPMDASRFIGRSTLKWAHEANCHDDVVAETVDEAALADGAYTHRLAVSTDLSEPGGPVDCPERDHIGRPYHSNESTHPLRSDEVPGREGFYLDLDDDERKGSDNPPLYWEYRAIDGAKGAYVFWFFYAYNDYVNKHEGDWERIAVQVDGDTPTAVVFWRHEEPPCRVHWSNLDKTEDGHPVTYAAKNAHGSYPHAGMHWHAGGIDETNQGTPWQTWDHIREVQAQPWYGYGGAWGEVSDLPFVAKHFTGPDGPNPHYDKAEAAVTELWCGPPKDLLVRFTGNWQSTEPINPPVSPDHPSRVILSLNDTGPIGTTSYPDVPCGGALTFVDAGPDKLVLRETIARSSDPNLACPLEGTITLTLGNDHVTYSYQPKDANTVHTAQLNRI